MSSSRVEEFIRRLNLDPERVAALKQSKRILAISPHPDDTEIIAGGFLALAVRNGAQVRAVVVSDDRMSFTAIPPNLGMEEIATIRKREERDAMNILGVKDFEFLEYIDSQVPSPEVLSGHLIRIERRYQPDLVVTVDPFLPYEAHPDHLNTGRSVMQAVLFHEYPYIVKEAEVKSKPPTLALGGTASPNAILPIDDTIEEKLKSILAHTSQFPNREETENRIRSVSSALGKAAGCRYGEAFKVLLPGEIHLDPFASL